MDSERDGNSNDEKIQACILGALRRSKKPTAKVSGRVVESTEGRKVVRRVADGLLCGK